MSATTFDIHRRRRGVRASTKPRIAELGRADGTLYLDDHTRLWARWSGSKNAAGDATYSQSFPVYPGSSNYLPEAGRAVYIGRRYGKLTVLDAVPEDLQKAGVDLRGLNPNDPYRQFVYTVNFVPLRSDALANEGEDSLKVNLNQLLYLDSYGDYKLWNGTDENTHINFAAVQAAMSADEHALGIVALKTFENEPQSVASTPQDINTPLDLTDLQECKDQLDAETVDSRVYRITSDMVTLIANPTTDWDLRQWLNMPPRLGNPNPVTKNERVREGQQVVYHDFLEVTGWLEVLGEVVVIDDSAGETTTSGAPTDATYIVQTPSSGLSAEQAMSALATGIVKNATATGVQSIAVAGTDYTSPTGIENLSNKTITASSVLATAGGMSRVLAANFTLPDKYSLVVSGYYRVLAGVTLTLAGDAELSVE